MISLFIVAFGYFAMLPMTKDPPQVALMSKTHSHAQSIFLHVIASVHTSWTYDQANIINFSVQNYHCVYK